MKAYSQDLRDRIIWLHQQGKYSKAWLSRLFHIGYDTVCEWIKRYETLGDYSSKQGINCGRKERFNDKEAILAFLVSNPDADGIEIRDSVAPHIPMSTFYDTLKRLNITYKKKSRDTSREKKQNVQIT